MITAMLRSTAMLLVLCGTARAEQPFDPFKELKEGIGQGMEVGGDMPDDVSGGNVVIGTAGNVVGNAPGISVLTLQQAVLPPPPVLYDAVDWQRLEELNWPLGIVPYQVDAQAGTVQGVNVITTQPD
jgi:hypothetical protein